MTLTTLTEAFFARLVPITSEVTLGAIRSLKLEEYPPNAALAALGGLLALAIYYALGVWLRRLPERVSTREQQERIEGMRKAARFWLPYLLVLGPTPIGGIITTAAAFFRLKPALIAAILIAAEILFRAMPYLR